MKKIIYFLSLALFTFGNISFAATGNPSFSDVSENHVYFNGIEWVKENGIVKGYIDGSFKPDQTISRAEFVKILLLSKYASWGINENISNTFPDISESDWFENYISFAKENEIINGYSDGTFRPAKNVNFAEAAKIISLLHFPEEARMHQYTNGAHWYSGHLNLFRDKGLDIYDPNHLLTRGEMANILFDIYGYETYGFPANNTERENELEIILGKLNTGYISELSKYSIVKELENINGKILYVSSLEPGGPAPNSLVYFYDSNGAIEIVGDFGGSSKIYNDYIEGSTFDAYVAKHNISFGASLPEKYAYPEEIQLTMGANVTTETFVPFQDQSSFELNPYLLKTGIYNSEYGEVFTDSRNALVLRGDDFVNRKYSIQIPFLEDGQLVNIDWDNSVESGKYDGEYRRGYAFQDQGGCGSQNYASVITAETELDGFYINPKIDLVQTGTGNNGERIYELQNSNHAFLQNMYENKYFEYDGDKIAYNDFISVHPVFFWQDSFGRWIKFESNRFIPQAECGKPVIYLYPQEETEVSVKVSPKGGFSITEPEHGPGGWTVIAQPNGDLTEVSSGEEYPYLFWEGKSGQYESPEKGWIVRKTDADFFVGGKLRQFGFNTQEITDFLEFWSPKLQEGNDEWLFISFWGTQYMDSIAPIEISPQPDSIVRVLMDYHETPKFYEIDSPKIPQFTREGFVMTEWGGTLWR